MRIYNGKKCSISVPMLGTNRNLALGPRECSGNIMPTKEFLELLIQSFTPEEIAFIVAGTFEYNVCANIRMASNFCFPSLDECIEHFNNLDEKEAKKNEEPSPVKELEEAEKAEEAQPVVEEKAEEEVTEVEAVEEEKAPAKKTTKRSSKKSVE